MIAKTVEIRDRATFIPALAIRLSPVTEQGHYLLGRAGYGITRQKQGEYGRASACRPARCGPPA